MAAATAINLPRIALPVSIATADVRSIIYPGDVLPADILNRIQSLLPLDDYVRFPAVCASWRSAAKVNPNPHSDGMPWLVSMEFHGSYFAALCPSPANDRPLAAYKIPIANPESLPLSLPDLNVISSLGPRLVLCDDETEKLLLVNPFSSSSWTHYLPDDLISHRGVGFYNFCKLVAPPDYDGCHGVALALLIPSRCSTMLYSASGGPWIDLNDEYHDVDEDALVSPLHGQRFIDAVHYKGTLFFAVRANDENVVALDFSSSLSSSSCSYPDVVDMTLNLADDYLSAARPYPGSYKDARLVISPPYLYLLRWWLITFNGRYPTAKVYVYRLPLPQEEDDHNQRRCWVQVNELDGCSFFIGRCSSMSVPARDCPGLRPDRIYFPYQDEQFDRYNVHVSDYDGYGEDIRGFDRDIVDKLIYNLADGSWEEYCGWRPRGDPYDTLRSYSSWWMMPRRSASSSEELLHSK